MLDQTSKPRYLDFKVFAEGCEEEGTHNVVGVHLLKKKIVLDKMIFAGQAILDLSKLEMYELRYNLLSKYENEFNGEIRIAGGDTDSFFLKVILPFIFQIKVLLILKIAQNINSYSF